MANFARNEVGSYDLNMVLKRAILGDLQRAGNSRQLAVIDSDLQRTFFRMKRNFEKKQKNIAREYSMERKEGENSCYITAARYICQSHICQ